MFSVGCYAKQAANFIYRLFRFAFKGMQVKDIFHRSGLKIYAPCALFKRFCGLAAEHTE